MAPHFKTSGHGDSVHKEKCGFARQLSFQETVSKVGEYQASIADNGVRQIAIRLNLNDIDPDYEKQVIERDVKKKEKEEPKELDEKMLKDKPDTPASISSLKTIKKLFTTVGPDILAGILLHVKGRKIPVSDMIRHHEQAHTALWEGETEDIPYFIPRQSGTSHPPRKSLVHQFQQNR